MRRPDNMTYPRRGNGLVRIPWRRSPDPRSGLAERQRRHLDRVARNNPSRLPESDPSECAHNRCVQCVGTGVKGDGTMCVHHLVCYCGAHGTL